MYIVVVGGGTVGYALVTELLANTDHEVVLLEEDGARANELREEMGEVVIRGDGTEVVFLESVGTARADLMIAVTGNDSHNLVACQVAKHWFHVDRTIARVNDPRNERLFKVLGIDSTVSAASVVLAQLEVDLPEHTLIPLMRLRGSGLEVIDLHVQKGSQADGRMIRDLSLPPQTIICLVADVGGTPHVPSGDTVLRPGDEVIAVAAEEAEPQLRALVALPLAPESEPIPQPGHAGG